MQTGRLLLVVVLGLIGGGAVASGAPPPDTKIDSLLADLRSQDLAVVERAAKELARIAEGGLALADAERLLQAATGSFAKRRLERESTPADLVRAAARRPTKSLVPIVAEVFPKLPGEAQTEALHLLMEVEDRSGAETLIRLLVGLKKARRPIPPFQTAALRKAPRHADVYFPAMLEFATSENRSEIYAALLAALEAKAVEPRRVAQGVRKLRAAWIPLRAAARRAQASGKADWLWQTDYQEPRETGGILLDAFGYIEDDGLRRALREALQIDDPKLQCFAAVSLLRLGERVAPEVIGRIAASPEQRNVLYALLERAGKAAAFPARWRTREAFAESEMVGWLCYPTELGRPPDEIELMRVVSADLGAGRGVHEWYLFRFRTHQPHWAAKHGWLTGVAGPFKRSDAPSPTAHGDTFSQFERWDSKKPEEHVRAIREMIQEWQQQARDATDSTVHADPIR